MTLFLHFGPVDLFDFLSSDNLVEVDSNRDDNWARLDEEMTDAAVRDMSIVWEEIEPRRGVQSAHVQDLNVRQWQTAQAIAYMMFKLDKNDQELKEAVLTNDQFKGKIEEMLQLKGYKYILSYHTDQCMAHVLFTYITYLLTRVNILKTPVVN